MQPIPALSRALVLLVLLAITPQGTSEYRLGEAVVTAEEYNDRLKDFGVLVKARNFLVFQVRCRPAVPPAPQFPRHTPPAAAHSD